MAGATVIRGLSYISSKEKRDINLWCHVFLKPASLSYCGAASKYLVDRSPTLCQQLSGVALQAASIEVYPTIKMSSDSGKGVTGEPEYSKSYRENKNVPWYAHDIEQYVTPEVGAFEILTCLCWLHHSSTWSVANALHRYANFLENVVRYLRLMFCSM